MNQISSKEFKQYFKKIKLLMPVYRKQEKRFLKDFQSSVYDFADAHPDSTLDTLFAHFSTPDEIVMDYLASNDLYTLCTHFSIRKHVKRFFILLAVLTALSICIHFGLNYFVSIEQENQTVTKRLIRAEQ